VARRLPGQGQRIVTFLCDHGSRYASKVFDAAFLESKQLQVVPLA
jgi:cysteine synthase A